MKKMIAALMALMIGTSSFVYGLEPFDGYFQMRNAPNTANTLHIFPTAGTGIHSVVGVNGNTRIPLFMRLGTGIVFDGSGMSIGNVPMSSVSGLQSIAADMQFQITGNTQATQNNLSLISGLILSGTQRDFAITGNTSNIGLLSGLIASLQSFYISLNNTVNQALTSITNLQTSGAFLQSEIVALWSNMTGAQANMGSMNASIIALQAMVNNKQNAFTGNTNQFIRGDGTYATTITSNTGLANGAEFITGLAINGKQDKFTGTIAQFILGNGTYGTWSQTGVTRTLNNGFQISTTKGANVSYSVGITSTATLVGGQLGAVILEIASDAGFTTNLQEIGRLENGNSVSLAIALTAIQNMTSQLNGFVPPAYYVRLRTAQTTGTPTFAWKSGQEMLIG